MMHPRESWMVVGLLAALAALAAQAAVVYRWVDADGVVHYSDQPVPGAQRIVTAGKTLNGYSAPSASSTSGQPPGTPAAAATRAAITIVSPQAEQNFFNDEPIEVGLSLTAVKVNQSITWHLNGKELTDQSPNATRFVLPNPGRGTFVIAATVSDPTTGETQSTPSVTFYVREPSVLSPQHRNP
jgi:hypothetical protein